ncbi:MAG: hypothetical protein M0D55_20355 [Elusimicrobiota bacterium]|nr:MAG: hypothetical protein M0D55_20355 [Elusimicrobiota bacterium]
MRSQLLRIDAAVALVTGILAGLAIEALVDKWSDNRRARRAADASRDPLTEAELPHTALEEVTAPIGEV